MIVCLSFDDGRDDAYQAFQILRKNLFKASFHVTTGFVDRSFITDAFGKGRTALSEDKIKEMYNDKMDISSHGDKHIMEKSDFHTSLMKIKRMIGNPNLNKIGFSIPNSKFSNEDLDSFVLDNIDIIKYVRVGRHDKCYSFINKIHYLLYHLFKFQYSFNHFNKPNLINKINKYKIHSIVIKKDTNVSNLIRFIQKYETTDYKMVLMFHSIVNKPGNEWEYSLSNFSYLCNFLKNNKMIKVQSIAEMVDGEE